MSEEGRLEETIRVLMAREIADDVCDAVVDPADRGRCRVILFRILTEGRGADELRSLSEESRLAIEDKLSKDFGLEVKLVRL